MKTHVKLGAALATLVLAPLGAGPVLAQCVPPYCEGGGGGGGGGGEPQPPEVTTGDATNVTATTAVLNGMVDPNDNQTQYYFEFGTTPGYGAVTPANREGFAGSGSDPVPVAESVSGLSASTTYHYRLVGFTRSGTSTVTAFGADRAFRTSATPQQQKVRPLRVTSTVKPKRDARRPFKYRAKGRVVLPAGFLAEDAAAAQTSACSGRVRIRIKQHGRRRGQRVARVRADCRYSKKVRARPRGARGRLSVKLRFLGNAQLKQRSARTRRVYFGPRR